MTNKKDNDIIEVDGEKGEKRENAVVHVDKDGAEEIKKLKNTLSSKKGTATRFINKFKKQVTAFNSAVETDNKDNTNATRTALKIAAEHIVDSRN